MKINGKIFKVEEVLKSQENIIDLMPGLAVVVCEENGAKTMIIYDEEEKITAEIVNEETETYLFDNELDMSPEERKIIIDFFEKL